jgi:hypothetical protein
LEFSKKFNTLKQYFSLLKGKKVGFFHEFCM